MRTLITTVKVNCDDCKKEIVDYGVYPTYTAPRATELCRKCEYARVSQSLSEVKAGNMIVAAPKMLKKCGCCNGVGKLFVPHLNREQDCDKCLGTGSVKYD